MLIIVIRTIIVYAMVILSIRLMGKRQIGDLQPSELVITILISDIASMPIQNTSMPIHLGIIATLTLVLLEILTSFIAMKYINVRKLIYGTSAVIINNGIIDQKVLRRLRITGPDLIEVLRNQEIFDIKQVAYAILETNGQLSVLLKQEYQNASVSDLNGMSTPATLPYLIISDGKLLKHTIKDVGITNKFILNELKKQKVEIKDVFIMTYEQNGNFTVIRKND